VALTQEDDMADGKVTIITGGGSGIGEGAAMALARRGGRVVIGDIDDAGGERVAAAVTAAGGEGVFVHADASKPEDNELLVRPAVERFGRLDGAVNNAGIGGPSAPTGEYPIDGWRLVMSINLDGVFYGVRAQIPAMLESGGGAIVNIASILGQATFAGAPAYVAAKHGVVGLSKQIANEYAAQGIRCTAVGPGFIDTPLLAKGGIEGDVRTMIEGLHPIGRLGTIDELGEVIAWLITDAPEFLTGAYLPVDGGYLTR
jgi:NAD(P)-dependent dehydrogenase (short-subunit alcohol dehydrogenase family)